MEQTEKVTLSLPKDLMDTVREIAPVRGYSKFIAEAVEYFIKEKRRRELRERLIAGYQANAEIDAKIAAEWAAVEDEAWLRYVPPYKGEEPANDAIDSPG